MIDRWQGTAVRFWRGWYGCWATTQRYKTRAADGADLPSVNVFINGAGALGEREGGRWPLWIKKKKKTEGELQLRRMRLFPSPRTSDVDWATGRAPRVRNADRVVWESPRVDRGPSLIWRTHWRPCRHSDLSAIFFCFFFFIHSASVDSGVRVQLSVGSGITIPLMLLPSTFQGVGGGSGPQREEKESRGLHLSHVTGPESLHDESWH